jgi:hypothetical protein
LILDPASESRAPVDALGDNRWYNVEEGRYFNEEEPSSATRLARDELLLYGRCSLPSPDTVDQHAGDRIIQSSAEPVACTLPKLVDPDGEGWNNVAVAELKKQVELIFGDREEGLPTGIPCAPFSRPRDPIELAQDGTNCGAQSSLGRGGSEELRDASRLNPADEAKWEQKQPQAEELVREVEVPEMEGEMQQLGKELAGEGEVLGERALEELVEVEAEDDGDNSEDEDYHMDDEEEDDEDIRPAKRRKLPLGPTNNAVGPTSERSSMLSRPQNSTPPSLTLLKMDGVQSQTDHGCPPTPIEYEQHSTPRPSRSPSATAKSVLAAEYEEWPFQGFLKRARIGNQTTFNLEFYVTHLPDNLRLSVPCGALAKNFGIETSEQRRTSHNSRASSKTRHRKLRRPKMFNLWTEGEDEILVKKDGCSWEEISAKLPSRTLGAIQVRYSSKLKSSVSRQRKHRRL